MCTVVTAEFNSKVSEVNNLGLANTFNFPDEVIDDAIDRLNALKGWTNITRANVASIPVSAQFCPLIVCCVGGVSRYYMATLRLTMASVCATGCASLQVSGPNETAAKNEAVNFLNISNQLQPVRLTTFARA